VTAIWIFGGVVVVGVLMALVASWRRRGEPDLGVVSSQWIAEQRLTQGSTRPR
jgi:hypothetical protein